MSSFLVKQAQQRLKGEITLLGDKSIACRSIILSAVSQGKTVIENFPFSEDCLYAIKVFQKLGIRITQDLRNKIANLSYQLKNPSHQYPDVKTITVFGKGLYGLKKPKGPIFVGDSGTTLRLALGVLAGHNFAVTLNAGKSLSRRPMLRVTAPLRQMGAIIKAKINSSATLKVDGECNRTINPSKLEEYPPIIIKGGRLKPIAYKMPVASAQVKSAVILAGLYVRGSTCVIEPVKTRDHTERMLKLFRADIKVNRNAIFIKGDKELVSPGRVFIPGDISSASFFIVLAAILPHAQILIKDVNLNSSRTGIIKVLKRMGANIRVTHQATGTRSFEPMGDLVVKSSKLKGAIITKKEIPSLIDELPILMVAACFAQGKSIFEGVGELRLKETDRIKSISDNLIKMGADIKVIKTLELEKIIIQGGKRLKGASVRSFADHRTAMSMVVAGLLAQGKTKIDDIACINKSFPNFLTLLKELVY